MERGAAVVDGVVVPQEQAVFDDAFVALGGDAGDAGRYDGVAVPEHIHVAMHFAGEVLQVGAVVGVGAIAPEGGRAEEHLRRAVLGLAAGRRWCSPGRRARIPRHPARRNPASVVEADGEPARPSFGLRRSAGRSVPHLWRGRGPGAAGSRAAGAWRSRRRCPVPGKSG